MSLLARCFLLVFAQLYIGGLLSLSVPPFHRIARGFYKSTAGVYVGAGILALAGRFWLIFRDSPQSPAPGGIELLELLFWTVSVVASVFYLRSLWGDRFQLRASAYAVTWLSGLVALALGAQYFRLGPALSLETLLYPLSFSVSALVLGSVSTGMLLGHWYLIDHDLSIDPFRDLFRFFVRTLAVQAAVFAVVGAAFALLGSDAADVALAKLLGEHSGLLLLRLGLSPLAAAGIAWMIWKTLEIPQTMAATGLFYIAILAVLVGEMMGRFILFRTAVPL
jgi:hypothetical protein